MTNTANGIVDAEIKQWLDAVTQADVVTAVRRIDPYDVTTLTDDERGEVANARPQRRAEFSSGRAVLHAITGDPGSIRIGADGRPLLPGEWIASLAHDQQLVVAIAAPSGAAPRTLGVDVELAGALEEGDAAAVAADNDHIPWTDPVATLVAKEAALKAWAAAQPEQLRRSHPERWPSGWLDLVIHPQPANRDGVMISVRCDPTCPSIGVAVAEVDGRWLAVADHSW